MLEDLRLISWVSVEQRKQAVPAVADRVVAAGEVGKLGAVAGVDKQGAVAEKLLAVGAFVALG
jgi:hypothetical protein